MVRIKRFFAGLCLNRQRVSSFCSYAIQFWHRQFRSLLRWISTLRLNRFNLILSFAFILLIFAGFAIYVTPFDLPVEGNLVVDQLEFLTTRNQHFLDRIKFDEIEITGQENYIFDGFEGEFNSKDIPQVKKLSNLSVALQNEEDTLTIRAASKKDFLEISQLDLVANTEVKQLAYEPQLLSFGLLQKNELKDADLVPLSIKIRVPTEIHIQGNYQISGVPKRQSEATITVQEIGEFKTSLPAKTNIRIKLHDSEKDIFFGNNSVERVNFNKQKNMLSYQEQEGYGYVGSVIRSGTLRMANQTVTVEKNQFVMLGDTKDLQSIRNLPYIRLIQDEASSLQVSDQKLRVGEPIYGLEVGISGRTSKLEVGINPNLPIKTIKGTFSNILSPEAANVLLIVFTAVFSSLVTSLMSSVSQSFQSGR